MAEKLVITYRSTDLADKEVDLRNGKANPWGWSVYEIWHVRGETYPGAVDEQRIGTLYCGEPRDLIDGYAFRIEQIA